MMEVVRLWMSHSLVMERRALAMTGCALFLLSSFQQRWLSTGRYDDSGPIMVSSPVLHGTRRRSRDLFLPFLIQLVLTVADGFLAMQVWPRQHELPQRRTWSRKLLHEGKTAATRTRSCGHHDSLHGHILSLHFFILFSLWADNLLIAVTAFSLHGGISVVAVSDLHQCQSTHVWLESFALLLQALSSSGGSRRECSTHPALASSTDMLQSSPCVSATRVLGAAVMHGALLAS